jgi:hypothetical protein
LPRASEDGFLLDRCEGGADGALLRGFEIGPQIIIRESPCQRHGAWCGKRQVEGGNAVIGLTARIGDERLPVLADPFIEAREFLSLDRCRITATKVARWRVPDAIRLPLAKIVFGAAHIVLAGRRDIPCCNHRNSLRIEDHRDGSS